MLTLFTNITSELTELEKATIVPMLIDTLRHTNSKNRYTGRNISGWFKACGYDVSGPRLRKMVNYIRVMNLLAPFVLIGASNGYYVTDDAKKVAEQIESIEGRIDSMKCVVDSLKAQKQNLIHNKN